MTKITDIPAIRFKGFSDTWEQRKVSEYANFFTGNGLNWNDISDDGEQECILYGNLYTDYGMITENIVYRTNTEIKNPVYSEYGDVLIPASDTTPTGLARATSLEKSGVLLGGDINIIRPNEGINGSCLSLALNANRKELIRLIKGTTVRHIHNSEIKDIVICLPKLETEQVRVSSYFKQLDHLITLHQREFAFLCKEKSKKFRYIKNAWEQRKLGDIATFINGRAYSQEELLSSGKYKVLRVGNFYTNDSWYYSDLELDDKYYAEEGDLLYTWSATFGPHIWRGDKVIYHYHIWKVELSEHLEKRFAVQLLEQDKATILSDKNGSTMVHITKAGMEEKIVLIPKNVNEQAKIGAYLDELDNLITLHQRKPVVVNSNSTMNALPNQHLYFQVLE